jgi:hypothetical protein
MNSLKTLIDMIATEAIEGFFGGCPSGECGDSNYVHPKREDGMPYDSDLPPFQFDAELVIRPEGHYEWVD